MQDGCVVCGGFPLAHLFAPGRTRNGLELVCRHPVCMNCAVRISLNNSVCPQCRRPFTHVRQYANRLNGTPFSEYDVSIHSFPTELPPSSPIIMSIAVNLIFNENERGGYDVLLPEYFRCVDDMDNKICRIQHMINTNIVITNMMNHQRLKDSLFQNMRNSVDHFKNRPLMFVATLIAHCVMKMTEEFEIFVIHTFLTDPREDEDGSNLFLLSISECAH
jgi:hypothetical protein